MILKCEMLSCVNHKITLKLRIVHFVIWKACINNLIRFGIFCCFLNALVSIFLKSLQNFLANLDLVLFPQFYFRVDSYSDSPKTKGSILLNFSSLPKIDCMILFFKKCEKKVLTLFDILHMKKKIKGSVNSVLTQQSWPSTS